MVLTLFSEFPNKLRIHYIDRMADDGLTLLHQTYFIKILICLPFHNEPCPWDKQGSPCCFWCEVQGRHLGPIKVPSQTKSLGGMKKNEMSRPKSGPTIRLPVKAMISTQTWGRLSPAASKGLEVGIGSCLALLDQPADLFEGVHLGVELGHLQHPQNHLKAEVVALVNRVGPEPVWQSRPGHYQNFF